MTFSEILKHIRTQQNYTQEQLARELNVSFSTINRWENRHTAPSNLAKMRLLEYCQKNCVNDEIITEISKI
ncbi:MAG: helix-turn-helix domain-containing protein [Ruminococcus flavefaciens]|nr:helix-turn-helix domain-containing protein [Ruminococcus flavefaciens]MCM1362420.1 helix-turn-helix domain-containing protein [Clostridiales bacterium]